MDPVDAFHFLTDFLDQGCTGTYCDSDFKCDKDVDPDDGYIFLEDYLRPPGDCPDCGEGGAVCE